MDALKSAYDDSSSEEGDSSTMELPTGDQQGDFFGLDDYSHDEAIELAAQAHSQYLLSLTRVERQSRILGDAELGPVKPEVPTNPPVAKKPKSDARPAIAVAAEKRSPKRTSTLEAKAINWSEVYKSHPAIEANLNLGRRSALPKQRLFDGQPSNRCISSVDWCAPASRHLLLVTSLDGTFSIWEVFSKKRLLVRPAHRGGCRRGLWNHQGQQILSVGFDHFARIYDVASESEILRFDHGGHVTAVCVHPDDPNVVLTGKRDTVFSWDLRAEGSKPARSYPVSCEQVLDLTFLPSKEEFVCSGGVVGRDSVERTISVWDWRSTAVISNQIYHERYTCPRIRTDPTRNEFVAQSNGGYIAVFSAKSPYKMNKYKRYEGHKVVGYPIDCDFSSDYSKLATGDAEGRVFVYDVSSARTLRQLTCGQEPTTSLAWHPVMPSFLVLGTWKGQLQFWK